MLTKAVWKRVSAQHPCPICGNATYCGVDAEGGAVRCMRVQSEKPSVGADGATGWIHKTTDGLQPFEKLAAKPRKVLTPDELKAMAVQAFNHVNAQRTRREVAKHLGVTVESLERLKVGYGDDYNGEHSTWPARDYSGKVVGIVRRYLNGDKKSVQGGSTGLFYCHGWSRCEGPVLVVEGGSDTAAGISAGLCVIGRPSNTGGAGWIKRMVDARCKGRPVVVIGELDEKPDKKDGACKDCGGCAQCFPGKFGAVQCAKQLGGRWAFPPAGCKDLREAWQRGQLWPELIRALSPGGNP